MIEEYKWTNEERTRLDFTLLELKQQKPVDYGATIAEFHQQIIALQNKFQSLDNYFGNISLRLDAHGQDIAGLKDEVDKFRFELRKQEVLSDKNNAQLKDRINKLEKEPTGIAFTTDKKPKRFWDIIRGK